MMSNFYNCKNKAFAVHWAGLLFFFCFGVSWLMWVLIYCKLPVSWRILKCLWKIHYCVQQSLRGTVQSCVSKLKNFSRACDCGQNSVPKMRRKLQDLKVTTIKGVLGLGLAAQLLYTLNNDSNRAL